jgi:hypothetical protein
MGTAGYQVATVYNLQSYTGVAALGQPVLYLAGASLAPPTGSNLLAPAPVGRYGAFVGTAASNNLTGKALSTESKQLPVRVGMGARYISFVTLSRAGGVGGLTPAYGN